VVAEKNPDHWQLLLEKEATAHNFAKWLQIFKVHSPSVET